MNTNGVEGAPQDPRPSEQVDVDTQPSEMKESLVQYEAGSAEDSKLDDVQTKLPLCICPRCDKVLSSIKSLHCHFGRCKHPSSKNDVITYACPFCGYDSPSDPVFDSIEDLSSHVDRSHPKCTLFTSLTATTTPKVVKKGKAKQKPPLSTSSTESSMTNVERRKSTRQKQVPDSQQSMASDNDMTPVQHMHPLCKCPSCPRILPPQGLFGHFGRLHSGQIGGQSTRFEWKNVSYVCPFCPEPIDDESSADLKIFRTVELLTTHVSSFHPHCELIRPNSLSPGFNKSSNLSASRSASSIVPKRKTLRHSLLDNGSQDDDTGTRKSQRSRRSAVHVSKPAEATVVNTNEGKTLYNCPDCEKKNLSKPGLCAHYGMVHGGKVDWSRVTVINPKRIKKKKSTAKNRTGPWSDEEHAAFLTGHKLYGNRWKMISVNFVPTRDPKQIGSHALNFFTTRGDWQEASSYRPELTGKTIPTTHMDVDSPDDVSDDESEAFNSDDGNSPHCIVCFGGGVIVCCSNCPRAYHAKCLAKDGHGYMNIDALPDDWQCNRCKKDMLVESGEEISQKYAFGNKKIRSAYSEFKDCADYKDCCSLLSTILDIVKKLKNYDYGYVFSEPVDVEEIPDYLDVISNPMDYGTIIERLEGGSYVDLIASDDISREDENSTMEEILLLALCDIERVHHNCQLYNTKGSSIYRISGVHANKWNAYFDLYILDRLPENVQRDLSLFRDNCELEFEEGSQVKRREKSQKRKQGKSPPTQPKLTSSDSNEKKRKASQLLPDDAVEDEEEEADEEEESEEEEVEEEPTPKVKKIKQGEKTRSPSRALLFTEDQMRALEHVFISSVAKLRGDDDLEACSALTSPLGGSDNDSTDVKHPDDPIAIRGGPVGENSKVFSNLTSVKSEITLQGLPKNVANASQPVPEAIASGHTNAEPSPALSSSESYPPPETGVPTTVNLDKSSTEPEDFDNKVESKGTTFQQQWYERLDELKKYKISHGTAVVSATSNDKLYHWRLRQRKRYHLTLHRMRHLKKDLHVWETEVGVDKIGKQWLLEMPDMKGVFSLSGEEGDETDISSPPFTLDEKDVELDEKTICVICEKQKEQLYCPLPSEFLLPRPSPLILSRSHSSRYKTSLFWDECLEELRFFQGQHKHTLVPRDFPHSNVLPVWVEIQRARYLLQNMGLFAGLTGWQILVLDELNVGDLSSLYTNDSNLAIGASGVEGNDRRSNRKGSKNSPEKKSWRTRLNDFSDWYQNLPAEDKARASELLPRANWKLYSWCWKQCNAASALLCMTPNINGISINAKKVRTLASGKFFHAFPYNSSNGLVCEDDYETCEAFNSTFQMLEDFSIKYGSTHIPDWYECDRTFRMWVLALENGLSNFVKGEPCVLSTHQIEKLILIGFCKDRDSLPNLSKSDVFWLKMFVELKRHREMFGGCNVSKDFPRLHAWIAEQKQLFKLSRSSNQEMMSSSRLNMLIEAQVDFFTGECLPDSVNASEAKGFAKLTSSPIECFPEVNEPTSNFVNNYGWNFQDNYWLKQDVRARFELFKVKHGHSIILATDDAPVYWWFVEKRGKMLLDELNSLHGNQEGPSVMHSSVVILRHVVTERERDGALTDADQVESLKSMFLWLHYCERLMMFKARKGHSKLPPNYPDGPLCYWLSRQQELIHLYSNDQPTELSPSQLKILHMLGVHGKERVVASPKMSSRTLQRKHPSMKDKKVGKAKNS